MALTAVHKEIRFGIGDRVKVVQKIRESGKTRSHTFEGQVLKIKGREENKSITVRRIGLGQIGIERIYPLASPTIERIEVTRQGTRGVKRAKLYYTRDKSRREIEKIFSRAKSREKAKSSKSKKKSNKIKVKNRKSSKNDIGKKGTVTTSKKTK